MICSYEELRERYASAHDRSRPRARSNENLGRMLWDTLMFGKEAANAKRREQATLNAKLNRLFR
jgi:hypothetical protein